MITVDYFGRTGNQLFQYAFARIMQIVHGGDIYTPQPKVFLPLRPVEPVPITERGNTFNVTDNNSCEVMDKVPDGVTHLHLHGYFQKSWFYNQYREQIKNMFDLSLMDKWLFYDTNYDDIVIHLRLTDYFWIKVNSVICPDWYADIVRGEKYKKCYVVVEDHPTNKKYLNFITSMIPRSEVVTGGTAIGDFEFIRKFDRIVCSNSTFCWWAAFLSEASKVWTFTPWMHRNAAPDLSGMIGAKPVAGKFFHDRELASMDWGSYWNK